MSFFFCGGSNIKHRCNEVSYEMSILRTFGFLKAHSDSLKNILEAQVSSFTISRKFNQKCIDLKELRNSVTDFRALYFRADIWQNGDFSIYLYTYIYKKLT